MTVCVVGSGAREHALAHVLARSTDVIVTPGNPGTNEVSRDGHRVTSTPVPPEEIEADLYVVGPEAPLVAGLGDRLRARGHRVFGPSADGAMLEGSKAFMKELADAAGVPTARYQTIERIDDAEKFLRELPGPYVVKTDGLAAGKGVFVTADFDEALRDASAKLSGAAFGDAGRRLVIEEGLSGPELSLLVVCDGNRFVALPPARDYKRAGDGDTGPNTGGMGACSSAETASSDTVETILERIVMPTVDELRRRGIDYRGVLYAGCMLTDEGPKLIEYNVRFGDPEAEVVLPRLVGDVVEFLGSAADGRLSVAPPVSDEAAVCVVLAASGYPSDPRSGDRINGLDRLADVAKVKVFHGGTRRRPDGSLESAGGRVLTVSALGADTEHARNGVYEAIGQISFDGMQFRHDIGRRADHNVTMTVLESDAS